MASKKPLNERLGDGALRAAISLGHGEHTTFVKGN
jgi:hypothetical protein